MRDIPKLIVRYLPQFHQIPENDRWWGKGFTEWTAVKHGEKLYTEHNQPRIPLQGRYYNLLEKDTMIWQAELGRKYGIGCFSFYHYWFKDGRKILEHPAENLLAWQDVDMPFCFTWANETWARTWSKLLQKNAWADSFESSVNFDAVDGILLEQSYGEEKDWRDHFEYLLPFFQDKRYLKKDNCPVFIFYLPEDVPLLADMVDCWQRWSREAGFAGMYFIGEAGNPYGICDVLDAQMIRFPNAAISRMKAQIVEGVHLYDYDEYWRLLLREKYFDLEGKPMYLCAAVDYDTTPRKGKNGEVLQGASPEKFRKYFRQFVCKNIQMDNEYIFLNAWNEWGEGMYLEPDEKNGYGYLKAIHDGLLDAVSNQDVLLEEANFDKMWLAKRVRRMEKGCKILSIWLHLKEQGKGIDEYLLKHGWKNVAVYGLGFMGEHVLTELENSKVKVCYCIDQNIINQNGNITLYQLSDYLPPVDVIIVTPNAQYPEIREQIRQCVTYPVIPLEEIILGSERGIFSE